MKKSVHYWYAALSFLPVPSSGILYIFCLSRNTRNKEKHKYIYTLWTYNIRYKIHNISPHYHFFLNYLIKNYFDICIYLLIQISYSTSFYRQEIQLRKISLLNIICFLPLYFWAWRIFRNSRPSSLYGPKFYFGIISFNWCNETIAICLYTSSLP